MALSIQNEASSPAYLDYFGMTHPPFAALPEPMPIFFSEQHSLLISHLSNATEQSDRILLVCGAQGSGKTTLLNRYISGLGDDVWFATLDDSCTSATRFYCDMLEQLGFPEMTGGGLDELRNITREFLLHRAKANDNVLLIIDDAHRLQAAIFEQLRWIAGIKHEGHRVISIVLSGSPDLPKILESEAMKSICFSSAMVFTLRAYSKEETVNYITHRLRIAGDSDAAHFSPEARPLIYSYSGGIPDIVNTLCDGVLSEACAREVRVISEEFVHSVAKAKQISQDSCPSINKGRRKSDAQRRATGAGNSAADRKDNVDTPATERQMPSTSSGTKVDRQRLILDIVERDNKIKGLEERLAKSESECEMVRSELASREEELSDLLELAAEKDAAADSSETRAQVVSRIDTGEIGEAKQEIYTSLRTLKKIQREATNSAKELKRAKGAEQCVNGQLAKARKSRRPINEFEVLRGAKKVLAMKVADNVSRIMIGRSKDCELRLDSNFVSRHHAMICFSPDSARIQDLNSYNGTIVNSSVVSKSDLKPSDEIIIGDFVIRPTSTS